jgi:DNA-binding transcriptional ArsR family regulator
VLHLLRGGEKNVRELVEATGFSQPNMSAHLACLKDCGLVIARPAGRATYYSIADERIENLFLAAEDIVGRVASRLCNCDRYQS